MDLLLSRIGSARAARVSSCGRAAGLRGMVLVGSGLLQAALEERSAPGLVVVCAGEVIAISTSSRALLNGAASKAELPNEVSAFASAVSNSGAQGTELRIGRKKIKLSGEPFTDAESGKTFAIISLEEVQSPWDQVADREVPSAMRSPPLVTPSITSTNSRANRAGTRFYCGSGPSHSMQASVARTSTTRSSTLRTRSARGSSAPRAAR